MEEKKPEQILKLEKHYGVNVVEWRLNTNNKLDLLDLRNLSLKEIDLLSGFHFIKVLKLSLNDISDLTPLEQFKNLKHLSLTGNQITNLSPISGLNNLLTLSLSNNPIVNFKPISELKNLVALFIGYNPSSNFKEAVLELPNLEVFYCGGNKIRSLPKLSTNSLVEISLANNEIDQLDPDILESYGIEKIADIDLHNNPLPAELKEVISNSEYTSEVVDYLRSLKKSQTSPREGRMILLGEPRAGKTTLMKLLLGKPVSSKEDSTHDINIESWKIESEDVDACKVNVWDFGGQEILYSLHKYFLDSGNLYLIVLDDTKDQSPQVYIDFIENYAPGAPFLIISNRADERTTAQQVLAVNQYKIDYDGQNGKPHFKGHFANIAALQSEDVNSSWRPAFLDLQAAIYKEISQLSTVNRVYPEEYIKVKKAIETSYRNGKTYYLGKTSFNALCNQEEIPEDDGFRKNILRYLSTLGTLRFFEESSITALHILNPSWLIKGTYALLNHPLAVQNKGVLSLEDVSRILKQTENFSFDAGEINYIINALEEFSFGRYVKSEKRLYLPIHFDADIPARYSEFVEGARKFSFIFDKEVEPSLMTSLIVEEYDKITQKLYWKQGMVLAQDGNTILVQQDDRQINFYAKGQHYQYFLENARAALQKILRRMPGLQSAAKEVLWYEVEGKEVSVSLPAIKNFLKSNQPTYVEWESGINISRRKLEEYIGGYFTPSNVQQNFVTHNYFGNQYSLNVGMMALQGFKNELAPMMADPGLSSSDKQILDSIQQQLAELESQKQLPETTKSTKKKQVVKEIGEFLRTGKNEVAKSLVKKYFPQLANKLEGALSSGVDWATTVNWPEILTQLPI